MNTLTPRRLQTGFSLFKLWIVVSIISLLALYISSKFLPKIENSKIREVKLWIETLQKNADRLCLDLRGFLTSEDNFIDPLSPHHYLNRAGWIATTSLNPYDAAKILDGNKNSNWSSQIPLTPGQWIQIDLGSPQTFNTVILDPGNHQTSQIHHYKILVSNDGANWWYPIISRTNGKQGRTISLSDQTARYIKIMQMESSPSEMWTIAEFNLANYGVFGDQPISHPITGSLNRSNWVITTFKTNNKNNSTSKMIDGNTDTRWSSEHPQTPGQWIQIDLGTSQLFDTLTMNSGSSYYDYAHHYQIFVSNNPNSWGSAIASGAGTNQNIPVAFPIQTARYIKIVQTGTASNWWSIAELTVANNGTGLLTPLDRHSWHITASDDSSEVSNMIDNNPATRWTTLHPQSTTSQSHAEWIVLDLGHNQSFRQIVMDSGENLGDYAHAYEIMASNDGTRWNDIASGSGNGQSIVATFPQQSARYIKIQQVGTAPNWWSIVELNIYN